MNGNRLLKMSGQIKKKIADWNRLFVKSNPQEVIRYFMNYYGKQVAFSSSLGAEDQIITHMIAGFNKNATIFTLDTLLLFPETYDLIRVTENRYGIKIQVYTPDAKKVQKMVNRKGINLFYESIQNRKLCCDIRKMEPLKRALKGLEAWICGLRRKQCITRNKMQMIEWDGNHQILKINPIIHWNETEMWAYIRQNDIPYNSLHDQNFRSIGCQPCTRAVGPGEDARAGRWWWESPQTKECGLHGIGKLCRRRSKM